MTTDVATAGGTELLLDEARRALEIAKRLGADDAAIRVAEGRSTEFVYRDAALEKVQDSATKVLGVSLYVDGRYSNHQSNDLRPESLESFLTDAIALTRALEPDPHRKLPDPALYEGRTEEDLDLWDPTLVDLDRDTALEWLSAMDKAAHEDETVISSASQLAVSHSAMARVSSNGFEGTRRGTSITAFTEVTVQDEGDKRPEAYAWAAGRHASDLGDPVDIARRALRRAVSRKGSRKGPSTRTKMVLHREAGGPLIGRICGALSGGAIQQERSFLQDHLDKQIASPLLTITDEPWLTGGLASRDFDNEGIATKPRAVIENGVLKTFFVGTYYANKLGWDPTTGGPSNLVYALGDKDEDQLIADIDEGIFVTGWAGGNADMTTGDFSFGIRGFRIQDGKITDPVSEMNVTGAYLDLLPRLSAVGNDPFPWSSMRTPTLVFDDVQFSGS
ncbi:MAG: TldD/PmbA family protein [Planctomycetota bacterium]|nr:TldD/PmbA family protein [Planctomycetota bacterium]